MNIKKAMFQYWVQLTYKNKLRSIYDFSINQVLIEKFEQKKQRLNETGLVMGHLANFFFFPLQLLRSIFGAG